MYNTINKSNVFSIYDFSKGCFVFYGTKEELISFVATLCVNHSWKDDSIVRFAEEDFNFSGNDYSYHGYMDWSTFTMISKESSYSLRRYVVIDGYDRYIDIRNFLVDIKKEIYLRSELAKNYGCKYMDLRNLRYFANKNKTYHYTYGDVLLFKKHYITRCAITYRYRIDPVPYTSRKHCRCIHKKRGAIIRMISHPDFKKYNRSGHYADFDCLWWGDETRHVEKSWKKNKKVKKQWQKNLV